MRESREVDFYHGVGKLDKMLQSATDRHTKVVVGYLKRLVAVSKSDGLDALESLSSGFASLGVYPVFGVDGDRVTLHIMKQPV